MRGFRHLLVAAMGLVPLASQASPSPTPVFCAFDFLGASGDLFGMVRDYALAMQRHGVELQLRAFNDEAAAVTAYQQGRCDAVMATAFRTRAFNAAAASIDSLGATTVVRNGKVDVPATYEVFRKLVQTYAAPSPAVTRLMVSGQHEVAGIIPVGAAYPFVNDRRLNTVESLASKRIAAFDYDPAQAAMIQRIGGRPVAADIGTFHHLFNRGAVDMMAAPTMAYKPLELERGLGTKGGIVRFPLMIVSYQLVLNRSRFPPDFGHQSRAYWVTQFDRARQLIHRADASVPPQTWVDIDAAEAVRYTQLLRDARIDLARQGLYDQRGLKVLKRIRCHVHAGDPDCATRSEEVWE
ncbi:hypothetical protein GTZ97_13580 [Aquabacterium fontiphilum]|jgi:hypothetical protein|uniref:putative solute-binding protein n=1 Tax=Aquabacterium fontiphilum TaxID=450365 RepID=UPI0013788D91|nr:putative solute-binding protein [Aquabacterium fontiphilum]NBD21695.1 hypothetical protein [Aquabacterium fontiphilum]